MKERRKSLLSNEKMVSYTGSSIGSTHKQHSHTMKTQKIILSPEETGWRRKDGSLVQVIKRGLAILGPQQLVVISNTHKENYFTIKRGQEGVGKKEALVKQ